MRAATAAGNATFTLMIFEFRYHVPRSQVWQGSRGAQRGHTHLHVTEDIVWGRLKRSKGRALCGRAGWWERPPEFESEKTGICPRCAEIALRHVGSVPTFDEGSPKA